MELKEKMVLIRKIASIVALSCAMFVGSAHAAWVPPSWHYIPGDENNKINKPDQEANQSGWAKDPRWQMLGGSWGAADGVSWTVLGSGAGFGHEAVKVGDQVVFKFDVHKTLYGTHALDALRAWIDWGQDGFSAADVASDMIIEDSWLFNPGTPGTPDSGIYSDDPRDWALIGGIPKSLYYANLDKSFLSAPIIFSEAGDFDLLARVTCSRDLGADRSPDLPDNFDLLTPWANGLTQGEMELYTVHVNEVPLPAAVFLFGSGLFSLGFFRRRSKSNV